MQWSGSIGAARKTKHWQLRIIPSPRKESLHNHSRGVFWKLLHKLASRWTEALRLKGDWECLNLTNVPTEERSWMIMKEHRGIERWQKECKKYADWMARGTGGPLACLRHRLSPYLGAKFGEEEIRHQMTYCANVIKKPLGILLHRPSVPTAENLFIWFILFSFVLYFSKLYFLTKRMIWNLVLNPSTQVLESNGFQYKWFLFHDDLSALSKGSTHPDHPLMELQLTDKSNHL